MKKYLALIALTGLVTAGCSTTDNYGASNDVEYTTPSWGANSSVYDDSTRNSPSSESKGAAEVQPIVPATGYQHWDYPQVTPPETGN